MFKGFFFLIILFFFHAGVIAQVGFNNPNPDPTSILDLTAIDKGLLIPRLTTSQREAIQVSNTPARSLLVFDATEGKFYFYDGGTWYSLNEWVQVAGSNNVSIAGNVSATGNMSVTGAITAGGTITASNYALNSNGNGPVPAGGIIMWSGSLASIPTGWVLCDGTNGTVDLRDRFIVGAGATYPVGNTGGANTVTLNTTQIPSHTHTINSAGAHTHIVKGQRGGDNNDHTNTTSVGAGDKGVSETAFYFDHTSSSSGNHSHTANNTGGGQAHENRPPYYALAYIMKLP